MLRFKMISWTKFTLVGMLLWFTIAQGETVGVFSDAVNPQIKFAASEVKTALELKGFIVEVLPLTSLNQTYAKKKIVISVAGIGEVNTVLTGQNGAIPTALGEQAYALRTTTTPELSFWVLGGDANGAMYGGFQIAENIKGNGFSGSYSSQESPTILKRGIKLNLPWDKSSGTYGKNDMGTYDGSSSKLAIKDVWDLTFWTTWLDEMARNRYNVLSLWSCNPFTSLVIVPGYEDCSIQNVTYFDGTVKVMSMDEKITFWKKVMAYAHDRGFEFLLVNWNVFTYGATGKHGIVDGSAGATNSSTRDYMYKAMYKLLETYPDLDGFGLSLGENGGSEDYCWNTFGKAVYDYAKINTQRKLRFNHRLHYGNFPEMLLKFAPLRTLDNVTYQVSVKHSQAFMYSNAVPNWWPNEYKAIRDNNLSTWCEVRNDAFYYLTWGDPNYARAYLKGLIGLGSIFTGFVMGWDGFNPTRTFFSKNSISQGGMEVYRQQYNFMLFGRLSYNPNILDDVFKNYMALKYPAAPSNNLFTAWARASMGPQLAIEMIQGSRMMDYMWYPEASICHAGKNGNPSDGFVRIAEFMKASPTPGSNMCSIANSAAGTCGSKPTSYQVADSIITNAQASLALISGLSANANTELGVALTNIKGLAYLGLYYAGKIKGATYLQAKNTNAARDTMGKAYCNWMAYADLMDVNFTGMQMQRSENLNDWHVNDAKFLKEFTDLGGTATPNCALLTGISEHPLLGKPVLKIGSLTSTELYIQIPSSASFSLEIFSTTGIKVARASGRGACTGASRISLDSPLAKGWYLVKLRVNDQISEKHVAAVL